MTVASTPMRLEQVFAIQWSSLYPTYPKKVEANGEPMDKPLRE